MPNESNNTGDHGFSSADDFRTPAAPSLFESHPLHDDASLNDDAFDSVEPFAPLPSAIASRFPAEFGKYTLLEQIGRGGMGSVFRARQVSTGQIVALKLLRRGIFASKADVQRFEKESRIHANIQSPFIAQHIEFGEHQRMQYIVSEFVDGMDLQQLCAASKKLGCDCALHIIRDVLHALAAIHELGIVHRDVKPGNIMIVTHSPVDADKFQGRDFRQAKLMDFGISRQIDQSESLAMTHTDMTLGTPLYMAPEQQEESRSVTAAADVYAVGATIYQMLAGFPPFRSTEKMKLAEMHRVQQPEKLTRIDPAIGHAISGVVLKALEKEPAMRYADGGQMLTDVEMLLAGRPTSVRSLPMVTKPETATVRAYRFEWMLDVPPAALWPLVADTDRFNRALNLPPVEFAFHASDDGRGLFGSARLNGVRLRWLEHPFQWVVGRELSVLREFQSGPFEWVTSTVTLEAQHGDRTRLVHEIRVQPRGLLGRLVTPFQFGFVIKRQLDRVYRRIESLARQTENAIACDAPFTPPAPLKSRQLQYLAQARERVVAAMHDRELLDRFVDYLKFSADQSVARMRPVELAEKFGCDPNEFISMCLTGVDSGMLRLSWDVICPVCRIASSTADSLRTIGRHSRCEVCNLEFQTDFASSVELIFRVDARIRAVDSRTWCIGGPFHSPHVIAQNSLPANGHVEFGVTLAAGGWQFRSPQLDRPTRMQTDPDADHRQVEIELPNQLEEPLPIPDRFTAFKLQNRSPYELTVRLERLAMPQRAFSAALACAHPLFRRLFPGEILSAEDLVNVEKQLLVGCRIFEFEELVARRGEVTVNAMLQALIRNVVESADDVQLVNHSFSTFLVAAERVEEVVDVCELMARSMQSNGLQMSIVVNSGTLQFTGSIAGRKYFGKAIRETEELLKHARGGKVMIRKSIGCDRQILVWADQHQLDELPASLIDGTEYLVFSFH